METDLTPATIDKIVELSKKGEAKENRVIELDLGAGPKQFDAQNLRRIYDDPRPGTLFIFRYRAEADEIALAIFEADGGAWKHEAVENIAKYFEDNVPNLKVIA